MLFQKPKAWSILEACKGCGDITYPVFAPTPGRDMVTHGAYLPGPFPQIWLCCIKPSCKCGFQSWKTAVLEQVWESCHFPAKMVPEWPMACTLCLHLTFSHTSRLLTTYVHFTHGWGWKWGEHGSKK